jgi:hypothetical protein
MTTIDVIWVRKSHQLSIRNHHLVIISRDVQR